MTPELADKIMTRIIARVEADGGVLHKSSGIEEIIGTCAVAESEGEIIDVISYDEAKGQWVHKDGTPLDIGATGPAGMPSPFGVDMGDDRVEPVVRCRVQPLTSAEEIEQLRKGWLRTLNATFYNINGSQ